MWRRPELALFALVFGAYAYFYQAGGWNQNGRFDLTRALVEDHGIQIDRFASNTFDLARAGGHVYCDKAPGVSLLGAAPYLVVHAIAGAPNPSAESLGWASWISTVVAVALPSALGVVSLAWLLAALGLRPRACHGLAAAWGLATLAFPYSTLYYGHQLSGALLVAAFTVLVRIARGCDPSSRRRLVAAGAFLGAAVAAEYPAALGALVMAAYAARVIPRRSLLWIVVGALAPVLVLAAYHTAAFGAPWRLSYAASVMFPGVGTPRVQVLQDLTITPFRGLFFTAPWLVFALPGGARLWRSGARAETLACAAIFIAYLALNVSLVDWNGGSAIGPRHLVAAVPFLVVLVAGSLAVPAEPLRRSAAVVGGVLVAWSAVLMLAATAVRPEVDREITHPFGDYILPQLVRGNVATSGQSIDMAFSESGATRYAWNLGERLGLAGLASLLPLLVWCSAFAFIVARRTRTAPS